MADELKELFLYFKENHDSIFARFPGKFVVLREQSVVLAEDSFESAFDAAIASGLTPGEFLIQECTAGDSAYTQFFSSQIAFA